MNEEKEETLKRLAETVSGLYGSEKFSDISIKLKDRVFKAHRIILFVRSDDWSNMPLSQIDSLNWEHIDPEISLTILKWVYMLDISLPSDENFILNLMKHASGFKLKNLSLFCEKELIKFSCFENCIKFYTIAGNIGAVLLKNHCAALISKNWKSFTAKDFKDTNAICLQELLKTNADYPLHSAVKFQRADLVKTYLSENKYEVRYIFYKL